MSTAIEFNHISKQYRLGLVSTKTLTSDLNRWWQMNVLRKEDPYLKVGETNDRSKKALSDFVWALKDIDFKVDQGDVVGIIGKNGAGKSTLLKLLSRVTTPTTGTIKARGRIASLLEVGTGFHSELTGRENIYMNGAILGMSKQEINRKLDEIVDFSGCERYIDTPVKRYSSGMMVRLGFAVAAHLDPEILVVDEVLAVGDAEFQKKAIGKMKDVSKGEGRTVLFVSHNMASVNSLCNNCILLDNGHIINRSETSKAIQLYRNICNQDIQENFDFESEKRISKDTYISDFNICNNQPLSFSDKLNFKFWIKSKNKVSFTLRIAVFDTNETRVMAFDSADVGDVFVVSENSETEIDCQILDELNLKPGVYKINISIRQGSILLDHIVGVRNIEIAEEDFFGNGRYNFRDMPFCLKKHQWIMK